ncbi:AraC family transcriptional regulator [Chelatococcus reniformis]|uniref:AraC family transcriptional regulator n=1 Tax=Chelatococcus reniformis TaxID=1494448 RepID=A0A916URJ9_9HYPH|nr:AraC family transcriptional regulator [Chelatococcus reniformis]GGC81569.1 AraC family transcriptional regulator [Chelatococcus reniformis]
MKPETSAAIRLPNFSARIMQSALIEAGIDCASWLAKAKLKPDVLEIPNGQISGAQELSLQEAFVLATCHLPGLWFRMGLQYRLMGYGPLGFAVLSAQTLGDGLQYMSSFRALTYSLLDFPKIEHAGDVVAITADDAHVPDVCREFSQERGLAAATRIIADMYPGLSAIARIETVLDDRNGRREWTSAFGVPVAFNAPVTRLVFREGITKTPLPMANALLEKTYSELCNNLVDDAESSDEIVYKLHNILIRSAPAYPSAAKASRLLALSERTMYRRLADCGCTFGDILESVREQRANNLLDSTRLSVEQIAGALGFAEAASFSRAYKRWTGVSPLSYRRRLASGRSGD